MVAVDRFGKQIEQGHLIMFHMEEDLIFEVISVGPVLNPAVPGGNAIQVVLAAQFPVMFQPAAPNRTMVVVGETKARIDAAAARNGGGKTHLIGETGGERVSEGGIVLTDAPIDDGGPGDEGAPRDLGDTGEPTEE